ERKKKDYDKTHKQRSDEHIDAYLYEGQWGDHHWREEPMTRDLMVGDRRLVAGATVESRPA
ncbi:hypothetical protein, partial [Heyndrickxia coagulans]|uniref:hypothetical protein n=1 Tax=Heyndrickxia coagulans TaxID=1398 RepID=UPI00214DCABD